MARGNYTPAEMREMEGEDLLFLDYYQTQRERERMKDLAYVLGCRWTVEDLQKMADNVASKKEEPITGDALFIPLAMAINPELTEYLAKKGKSINRETSGSKAHIGGGSESVESTAVVKSFEEKSKEDFLRMVGGIGGRRA